MKVLGLQLNDHKRALLKRRIYYSAEAELSPWGLSMRTGVEACFEYGGFFCTRFWEQRLLCLAARDGFHGRVKRRRS